MKKQCPKCAAKGKDTRKDNLHIYPEGGGYCFSCGYVQRTPDTINNLKKKIQEKEMSQQVQEIQSSHEIHYDKLTSKFPQEVRLWLASKGVDPEYRKDIFWHESQQELVFPVHNEEGKITFTSNRYFGDNKWRPRYINRGFYKDNMLVLGNVDDNTAVFVVEDYISGIRVASTINPKTGKGFPCYVMFGSHPPDNHLHSLSTKFLGILYFFDPDKRKDSLELKMRYANLFEFSDTVFTDKDPKDLTQEDLERKLKFQWNYAESRLFDNVSPSSK